jgi:hypothetical protein
MIIQKTPPYNPNFGITTKPSKKIYYLADCWLEKDFASYKGFDISITKHFMGNKLISKLFYVKKAGEWIKSKLRYFEDGKWKVTRSESKCLEK